MVVNELQPDEVWISGHIEMMELELKEWRGSCEANARATSMDASMLTEAGIRSVYLGLFPLARECFGLALPQLLHDLGPDGPHETVETFVPVEPQSKLPEIEGVELTGGRFTWGWSPFVQSDWWVCVALCRWFLEGIDDRESLRKASECLHRHYNHPSHAPYAGNLSDLDNSCPVFVAAYDDQRCLQYLRGSRKFRPLSKPTSATTSRAMSYVLAAFRHEHAWTEKEMDKAWKKFLDARIHKILTVGHGGTIEEVALWMKLRYWDQAADPKPSSYDAFMRVYDHLPGVTPPSKLA